MDDQVFSTGNAGIVRISTAAGISEGGTYEFGISSAVKFFEPGVSLPNQRFGLVLNKPFLQLIIKTI